MKNFLMLALSVGLIGCAIGSNQATGSLSDLQYGMSKPQVLALLGKPEKIEIYKKSDQTLVDFYYYPRSYQFIDQQVPVCLINNRVVGWGDTFYQDHISIEDTRIK